jgi:hypothetical protein
MYGFTIRRYSSADFYPVLLGFFPHSPEGLWQGL